MKISGIHKADQGLRQRWLARFSALPPSAILALRSALRELAVDAAARAHHCWAKSKTPMAAYWRVISVYSKHLAAALNKVSAKPHVARWVAEVDLPSGESLAVYRDPSGGLFALDTAYVEQCFGDDERIFLISPLSDRSGPSEGEYMVELVEDVPDAAAA